MDKRVSKAVALKKVAEHYGVPPEQVMAIGDVPNDVGMLQLAGVAIAMDNATKVVKKVADWVAPVERRSWRARGAAAIRTMRVRAEGRRQKAEGNAMANNGDVPEELRRAAEAIRAANTQTLRILAKHPGSTNVCLQLARSGTSPGARTIARHDALDPWQSSYPSSMSDFKSWTKRNGGSTCWAPLAWCRSHDSHRCEASRTSSSPSSSRAFKTRAEKCHSDQDA